MSSLKILKSFRIPTNAQSFLLPLPSLGYCISGKEEVNSSGSPSIQAAARFWHHKLCCCHDLQLIQTHVAPSHGPSSRILSPLFFPARSLLLPKPCGKREQPKVTWSPSDAAAAPGFKSLSQSSSAAPFPTSPTISYTCQHSLFFQLYWAAIVSLGRCGPMAWSQSSPSSHAGAVIRGVAF